MTREDAEALLDVFRLDNEEPPPAEPERMARRFAEVMSRQRRDHEDGRGGGRRDR